MVQLQQTSPLVNFNSARKDDPKDSVSIFDFVELVTAAQANTTTTVHEPVQTVYGACEHSECCNSCQC